MIVLCPNWHEGGRALLSPCPFWTEFCQEVKIDINRVNLTPCQAHEVLYKMPLGGSKDEHFFLLS